MSENERGPGEIPKLKAAGELASLNVQVGGGHYKGCAIQPVEYIVANQLGFCEGCVVKYVTRHRDKGGAEDLRKAIHFIEMLLDLAYPGHDDPRDVVEASHASEDLGG